MLTKLTKKDIWGISIFIFNIKFVFVLSADVSYHICHVHKLTYRISYMTFMKLHKILMAILDLCKSYLFAHLRSPREFSMFFWGPYTNILWRRKFLQFNSSRPILGASFLP